MGDPSPDSEAGYDYQNDQTGIAGEREERHDGYNCIAPERGCKTGIHDRKLIVTRRNASPASAFVSAGGKAK